MNLNRRYFAVVLLSGFASAAGAADVSTIPIDGAKSVFAEASALCTADDGKLWGVSLCGPILLVDPKTRSAVGNEAGGLLHAEGDIFVGVTPAEQIISTRPIDWADKRWAEITWPLPDDFHAREKLITRELFRRIQNQLALPVLDESDNDHLATREGRYWMQLEWRALAAALRAPTDDAKKAAIADAINFRRQRYTRFPTAKRDEKAGEYNKGLIEYSGVAAANPAMADRISAALDDLSAHVGDADFAEHFADATVPAYGLLLDRYMSRWRQRLKSAEPFDVLLQRATGVGVDGGDVAPAALRYDGDSIQAAENKRDAAQRK